MTETFETADLATAAFLTLRGHSYKLIAADRPGQVLFQFRRTSALEAHVRALALNDANVDPLAFERVRRELLHELHDFLRNDQSRET